MTSRASARFGAANPRATRTSASVKEEPTPSSPELSSLPPTDDDEPNLTSKHFHIKKEPPAETNTLSKKRRRIKQEPSDGEEELRPAMGDARTLKKKPPPPAKKKPRTKKEFPTMPPENWEYMYSLTKQMRLARPAPVDTMGCDVAADRTAPPLIQRFHTLISLMLSSQTKDTINATTMAKLRTQLSGGLTLASILAVEPAVLNELIAQVGFHRRKTEYIKNTAIILRDRWGGDIPDSIEGLTSLPGVGPKMAHLCMSAAWDKTMGIGVDVHVHRICNLWGWVQSTTPEGTREQLEAWLPRGKWREVNWLLVGFGQTICLPRGRKCGECLLSKGLCRAAFKGSAAVKRGKGAKVEESKDDGEAVKADPDAEFKVEGGASDVTANAPRKTLRRRPVKVQVKREDEWMTDIEDVGRVCV